MKAPKTKKKAVKKVASKPPIKEYLDKVLVDTSKYNPVNNPKAISIIQQEDGNWKGWMQKFGKVVEVREIGPETVLQRLLTHGG